jgi:hypothetical protein
MEDQRTIFEIPAENVAKFEEQMAKLSKKSVKLGFAGIEPFFFSHEERTLTDGHKHRVYSVMLTAEMPVLEGWTFIARLDHANETGTIIRQVPNTGDLPEQYRTATTSCDHCNQNRYRRDTFIIREDATGVTKQVGSSCLKDFFGHDPYKIAKMAELLSYAYECGKGSEQYVGSDLRWMDLETYCAHAAASIRTKGWVSGKAAYENPSLTATRADAFATMMHFECVVTEEDTKLAADAIAWAISLRDKDTLSDYEHNINVIASAIMIEPRSMGLAASIVGVHHRNLEKAAPQLARTVEVGNFKPVTDIMAKAGSKLRFPKIRLQLEDGMPVVLSIAGARAKNPGSVTITDGKPFGENVYYGAVSVDGTWNRSRSVNEKTMISLTALLTSLATDPVGTAQRYGKLTGHCCFCALPLTDARSVAVGYGKICASKYEFPWGSK